MQKQIEKWLIFIGAIFYIFVFPHGIHGDGTPRYITLEQFLTTGTWIDSKYPMIGSLFSAPFFYLGYLLKDHHWWVSRYNSFLFLILLALLWQGLKQQTSADFRRRFILLLMAAGLFPRHGADFYGEMFTCLCLSIGFLSLIKNLNPVGVTLLVFGVMNTPATLIAVSLGVFMLFVQNPRRFCLFIFPPLALSFILLENYLRRGSGFDFGYDFAKEFSDTTIQPYSGQVGFSYPFGFGLLSVLFSFGKGLVFFIPGLFFIPWLRRRMENFDRALLAVWGIVVVGLILTYSRWHSWHGGWFWGPRFYLFACVPALYGLAFWLGEVPRSLLRNSILFLILALSVWVSGSGIAFGLNNMNVCADSMEYVCLYVPEFSPLWRPFIMEKGLNGKQTAFLIFHAFVFFALGWRQLYWILRELRRELKQWLMKLRAEFQK